MGACITRCLPLYSDPRYQPVRSRYLIQDDVVQAEPNRASRISASSDESLCMSNPLEPAASPQPADDDVDDALPLPADDDVDDDLPLPADDDVDDDLPLPADPDPDPLLLLLIPGLAQSPVIFVPVDPPPLVTSPASTARQPIISQHCQHAQHSLSSIFTPQAEDEVELTQRAEQPGESTPHLPEPRHIPTREGLGYGGAGDGGCGGSAGEQRWWGSGGSALPGSLPSLAEAESPPTASLDLEWEPEAGLGRVSRESLGTGEEETSQTAESSSWVPRSACSTPNSLEWDFRASTLSLRGPGGDEEAWQTSDQETEQLLYEIEQLAARALADTGHGLQPNR